MTELEIVEYFEQEFIPVGIKGNQEQAFKNFRYAILAERADAKLIVDKWKEYMDMCMREERKSQYIKNTASWLEEKGWMADYKTKDMKTRSFVERWLSNLRYLFT